MGWLTPLKRAINGNSLFDLATDPQELQRTIAEGADIVLRYRRNPMMPAFHHQEPLPGVAVVRNEHELELYLAGMILASVKRMKWQRHRFYYPCMEVPKLPYCPAWAKLSRTIASAHGIEPLLTHEKDVWVFDGVDWLICEAKLMLSGG